MHITVNGLIDEITTFPILPFLLPYLIIAVYWQELCEYYSSDLYSKYKKNKCYKYISTWFLCLLFVSAGFDCPVCSKFVCSDEIEDHLLMCFSKPRLNYNGKNNLLGHSLSLQLDHWPVPAIFSSQTEMHLLNNIGNNKNVSCWTSYQLHRQISLYFTVYFNADLFCCITAPSCVISWLLMLIVVMGSLSVDDVLSRDSGECSICLDDMFQGDTIARLPCLCVYHKGYEKHSLTQSYTHTHISAVVCGNHLIFCSSRCIDEWFEVNRSCPEHPTD